MTASRNKRAGVALVVGVSRYPHPGIRPLQFAARDARAVARLLADPDVCNFPDTDVMLQTDKHARRDAIVQRLSRWLPERAAGAEVVVIYFAGHGMVQRVGAKEEG